MKKLPLLLFLLLSIGFAIMLVRREAPAEIGFNESKPFPAITVTTPDGKTAWDTTKLKGRVTVINFFASWCTPCAAEMPELAALKKQFPGVTIEGIAWNDDPKTLQAWLKKHGNPFTQLWLDKKGDATIDLGIKGIPETFIVDANGTIRYHLAGPLTASMLEGEIGTLLGKLVGETQARRASNAETVLRMLSRDAHAEDDTAEPPAARDSKPAPPTPPSGVIKIPDVQTLEQTGQKSIEVPNAHKKANSNATKMDKERMRHLKSRMLVRGGKR